MPRKPLFPMFLLTAMGLHGQAMIEYGVGAGRAGASAGAAGAGKSATQIFDKIGKSLGGAAKTDEEVKRNSARPAATVNAVVASSAPAPAAAPAPPADFSALVTGMDRADLLKKVGKPSMSMSNMESSKVVETCWYKNGADSITVVLRDGKVAEISGLEKTAPVKP